MKVNGDTWQYLGTTGDPRNPMRLYYVPALKVIQGKGKGFTVRILDHVSSFALAARAICLKYSSPGSHIALSAPAARATAVLRR